MLAYLKAIVGGIVGLAATLLAGKYGLDLGAEAQASIVTAAVGLIVYLVPNIKTA